jgi:hypothetical protein
VFYKSQYRKSRLVVGRRRVYSKQKGVGGGGGFQCKAANEVDAGRDRAKKEEEEEEEVPRPLTQNKSRLSDLIPRV